MKPWEIILYVCAVIAFLVTSSGIMRGKKVVAVCGAIAMAIITGTMFYMGWLYG